MEKYTFVTSISVHGLSPLYSGVTLSAFISQNRMSRATLAFCATTRDVILFLKYVQNKYDVW